VNGEILPQEKNLRGKISIGELSFSLVANIFLEQ